MAGIRATYPFETEEIQPNKKRNMERFYFTFMMSDTKYHNCYHVEEAKSYEEARDKMVERFGTGWAFQYNESQWKIPKEQYEKRYSHDPMFPDWFDGMTQADLFNLKKI